MGLRGQLTPKENYHLTLAFLGDRDERQVKPIGQTLKAAAEGVSPLELAISGFGYFGRRDDALLYAKLAPCPPLQALSDRLRGLLIAAGEAFDLKPFAAHITLARQADLTAADLRPGMPPISFTADRLTLFHSTKIRGELRYLPVFESNFSKE